MAMSSPRLEDVLEAWFNSKFQTLNTSEPGSIVSYDSDSFTATVQPSTKGSYQREDGTQVYVNKPIIHNVRVLFQGSSEGQMLYKLKKGTPGMLLFASAPMDNYQPDSSKPSAPNSSRRHSLSDAVFIPNFVISPKLADKPTGDDEVVLAWDKVLLGSADIPIQRAPVITDNQLSALAQALIAASATPGPVTTVGAVLAAVGTFLNSWLTAGGTIPAGGPTYVASPVKAKKESI